MITRVEAYRYRCFSKLAIDFQPFNVLAGPNGSGKTTMLDIPLLLGDCIDERVCSDAFLKSKQSRGSARAHTLPELVHQERGTDFVLVVECRLPENLVSDSLGEATPTVKDNPKRWLDSLRYEVRFEVFNERSLQVLNEYLFLFPSGDKPPELGQGLQGEPELAPGVETTRIKLRQTRWRSVIHRDQGDPARIMTEGYGRGNPYSIASMQTRLTAMSNAVPNTCSRSTSVSSTGLILSRYLVAIQLFDSFIVLNIAA